MHSTDSTDVTEKYGNDLDKIIIEEKTGNRFDPFDTSCPDYSERYSADEIEQKDRYQCRFRQRKEEKMPNPSEPQEYTEAITENNSKLQEFFDDEGKFDMENYVQSDAYLQRRKLIGDKLLRKIARDMNNDVDKEFADSVKEIKITKPAFEKAQYIASRVEELNEQIGRENYEIGMYMIGRNEDVLKGEIIAKDIYIGQEQVITPSHCDITPLGVMRTFREVRNNKGRIIGWVHSHANHSTFFSGEDDETLKGASGLVAKWAVKKGIESNELIGPEYEFGYFLSFVVNGHADIPAFRIVGYKPRFYVEDRCIRCVNEIIDLERTPCEHDNYEKRWPIPNIIEERGELIDTKEIDKQIIQRIIFPDGRRMSEYFEEDGKLKEQYRKRDLREDIKSKVRERRKTAKKEEASLEARVAELEAKVVELEKRYEEKSRDYEKRIERLENITKGSAPYEDNRNYYAALMNSGNEGERLLGSALKILEGRYRSSLKRICRGNYGENGKKRIRKWKERTAAVEELCRQNKDVFSDDELRNKLIENLKGNRYIINRHMAWLKKLTEMLRGTIRSN
jgi:hypothetical protein